MKSLNADETAKRIAQIGLERSEPGGFSYKEAGLFAYSWHEHRRHQLIYALSGRVILESASARWLLPPLRAALIPAGLKHRTALEKAQVVSVYFADTGFLDSDIRVLRAGPLLREMLVFADRWKVEALNDLSNAEMQLKESFFSLLSKMCTVWLQETLPYHLPRPKSERLEKAIQFLLANLDCVTVQQAAQVSGQSVRTLHRSMAAELNMTWKDFLRQARLLEAMDALLTSERSILDISLSVGYESPSAFTKAFHRFTGSKPLEFRKSKQA